jgi:hypothetical protein
MHFVLTPNISIFFVWSIFKTKRLKTGSVRDSVCSANFFVLYSILLSIPFFKAWAGSVIKDMSHLVKLLFMFGM